MKHKAKEFVQPAVQQHGQKENMAAEFPLFGNSVFLQGGNLPVRVQKTGWYRVWRILCV